MNKQIGLNLKNRRNEIGLTVNELSERIGVSRATWYRYEAGYVDRLTPLEIKRIAKALRVNSLDLLGFDDNFYMDTPSLPDNSKSDIFENNVETLAEKVAEKLNEINSQNTNEKAPRTTEARIVSFGMDNLPKENRELILGMIRGMFAGKPEAKLFEDKEGKNDDA